MGKQRGKAPLLTVNLAPVTVELNLRESGARFPCKWSSVLKIYRVTAQPQDFSVVYHFGSLLGVSHDTACCYHYKGSDLSGLFRRVSGLICP